MLLSEAGTLTTDRFLNLQPSLSLSVLVRLGQPELEGTDPPQHMAPLPRTQPAMDPHLLAAICPRVRVRRGPRLQQVRAS